MRFAREIADHVYFMDRGSIIEHGAAKQIFEAPRHERLQTFLSRVL
jgi:polar amino acid transport system ATP-binding protein